MTIFQTLLLIALVAGPTLGGVVYVLRNDISMTRVAIIGAAIGLYVGTILRIAGVSA